MSARRKAPARLRPGKPGSSALASGTSAPEKPVGGDALAAIARAQEGQLSAEGFWKTAGRFTKLR